MRHSNIIKLDTKGRILLPSHIRKFLGIKEGSELIIVPNEEENNVKIFPLVKGKTAEIMIKMGDSPSSLADIARILEESNIGILISQTKSITRGRTAEWNLIVDISRCNNGFESIRERILELKAVRFAEIMTGL